MTQSLEGEKEIIWVCALDRDNRQHFKARERKREQKRDVKTGELVA